jgi:FMN-dependent NADH-azoreductase
LLKKIKMNILHLISSPRGEASFSIKLGNEIVAQLKAKYPGSKVGVHDLTAEPLPHLEDLHVTSFFTPAHSRSAVLEEAVKHSDQAIAELMAADVIVIGVPMYNFGIHSALKAWIDQVVRAGVTFSHSAEGVTGLVKSKKVYLAVSSGGVYSEGPMKAVDFAEPYVRNVLNFIGITDVTTYRVEGVSMPELQDLALEKAIGQITL